MNFDLRQKPNSRERIIFFVALAAFAFVFFRSGVMETRRASSALEEDLAKASAEKTALSQSTMASPRALDKAASEQKFNWIGKGQSIELATDALVQSAQKNGIALLSFNFPEMKDKQNFLFKPISLTLSGTLAELGRYLQDTEHLAVPLVIERLSFEPSANFADIVTLRLEGGFYAEK